MLRGTSYEPQNYLLEVYASAKEILINARQRKSFK